MIYVYYIEPLNIVLNLCLSFSPAEWSTDVVMDFFVMLAYFVTLI